MFCRKNKSAITFYIVFANTKSTHVTRMIIEKFRSEATVIRTMTRCDICTYIYIYYIYVYIYNLYIDIPMIHAYIHIHKI